MTPTTCQPFLKFLQMDLSNSTREVPQDSKSVPQPLPTYAFSVPTFLYIPGDPGFM